MAAITHSLQFVWGTEHSSNFRMVDNISDSISPCK
jgi:hypothetical protein